MIQGHSPGNRPKKRIWITLIITILALAALALLLYSCSNRKSHLEDAYVEYINDLDYPEGYADYPHLDYLRFSFGYVDDDDTPELFLACGDSHTDQITVCRYNKDTHTVDQIGSYSSFGSCDYYERQDVIVGQYGGTGAWFNIYEGTDDSGARSVLAIEGSNYAFEEPEFFWASPYDGSLEDAVQKIGYPDFIVSEEEHTRNCFEFVQQFKDEKTVTYGEMTPYSEEAFRLAWTCLSK